ncbi:hypothetical protein [Rhizobium leguminosarum]|uniref:Uncharacterized protein n=1 Tax=Rhizobium leguminosarum TaxID=384 RepID=A0A7K3VTI1_RHILE|nr:hypothetical protein [Rhizobium leguminosarum]NEK19927.1 hypothetical protein [Rhizobium leguminosarum]
MANITKKIRIEEYDVLNNEFIISFQLAPNGVKFDAVYDSRKFLDLREAASRDLLGLGYTDHAICMIIDEIFEWMEKPRKSLDGLSHGYTMRSGFEVIERLEQERRGKVEAERIIAAAPPLDWAMSALDELERDAASESEWDKIKEAEWGAPKPGMPTSTERDALASQMAGMVAPGLGEKPTVKACSTNFVSLSTLLDNLEAAAHRSANMPSPSDRLREIQPHRIAIFERFARADEQDRGIAYQAVDGAVSAIHTQAIRFLTPMSYREHEFFRHVVREEIAQVIVGVL